MNLNENVFRRRFTSNNKKKEDFGKGKNIIQSNYNTLKDICDFEKLKVNNFDTFIRLLHKPTCSSNLGVVRALFGFMMVIDIPDERGLWNIDLKYGDPMRCHFPLFNWMSPLSFEYMGLLYLLMWLGALGICLGFKFQSSCFMFILPYWYIYLLDKTVWNNHSYLYGLVAILFSVTQANNTFSLDALFNHQIKNKPVPMWNYAIIRFQFFLLYFYAGVKKFDSDWIGGYSMSSLGLHWVFNPFRLVLKNDQIDFWIIHIFGFLFDLTVGFFLLMDKTRLVAMIFSTAFHVMNSCMFHIGQFPYVCLVTTPIFCSYDWPEQLLKFCTGHFSLNYKQTTLKKEKDFVDDEKVTRKQKLTCFLLGAYIIFQLFLPYSHFITQGYNNWTNGLYGYSWDMMVQNWNSDVIVVRVIDNQSKEEYFLDPEAWVGNTRYSKHGDMLVQYAKCLKRNLNTLKNSNEINKLHDVSLKSSFNDISIYVDVWCSLNGRFQQRMFDPRQDLLTADWDPFKKTSWLMPLLSELSTWRSKFADLEREVFKWSNYSDVLFVADFPGLFLEHYINSDFKNMTLTILQGAVILEQINDTETFNVTLYKGDSNKIKEGSFHKVYTISEGPSCYMYTYNNYSLEKLSTAGDGAEVLGGSKSNYFVDNLKIRIEKFWNSLLVLQACFSKLLFNSTSPVKKTYMA